MSLEARLIDHGKSSGRFNNAMDVAILEAAAAGEVPPTLIFKEYEPTVLIGRSQSHRLDIDSEAASRYGVEVLRRDSGGQSVYLNEDYIVFALIGRKDDFDWSPQFVRKSVSTVVADTLLQLGIPASFFEPDNVVMQFGGLKTLGNAGQIFSRKSVVAQGSIRYKLSDYEKMIDILKINGFKLQKYDSEIKEILTDTVTWAPEISKQRIKDELAKNFAAEYGLNFHKGKLSQSEVTRINKLTTDSAVAEFLKDKPTYESRGVCYFFVGGKNLVPSSREALEYMRPSTAEDSTID